MVLLVQARGTVFERQQVMEDTHRYLNSKRLSDRAKAVAGDFFTGADPRFVHTHVLACCLALSKENDRQGWKLVC